MRCVLVFLLSIATSFGVAAQPADCPTEPESGPTATLSLDLAGRAGVPSGITGQAYFPLPLTPPGVACRDLQTHLRGEPADVLHGESGNLLRGRGTPHVQIERMQ